MRAIIAKNHLGYIGKGNTMLWRSSDDFKHFKEKTLNQTLLVGYNTHSELPPLKQRTIILDERDVIKINDIDWCIGGKKTYEKYCHLFTELHISHIDDNSIGDVMFPDFKNLNPECKIFNYNFKTGGSSQSSYELLMFERGTNVAFGTNFYDDAAAWGSSGKLTHDEAKSKLNEAKLGGKRVLTLPLDADSDYYDKFVIL